MEQTFIMIKPDGVQRGLVNPNPRLCKEQPLRACLYLAIGFVSGLLEPSLIIGFVFAISLLQIGDIISRFEKKGYYLKGMKFMNVDKSFAQQHYADLSAQPFFAKLVDYIISGPVVAMVWEGKDVVLTGRRIIGATRPWEAAPGTIRGDHAVEVSRNVIHGSDSVENGKKEIALWFPGGLAEWKSNLHPWIYEN
ncbi:hypothetical protein CFC21_052925 [Triticum aestivum]|uniref:Nucleoside diphosphate kinase n=3 Tax=Triticum TaxID=4564 RepID=A0A9R0SEZ0_TRITD|nr:hypothetical protein CFC21_052925 [Triticum aestivum]VAH93860.1 unnamed protein product [Triticum turgidum subsp. durum]